MNSGIVYSTDTGKICPDCDKPANQCICRLKAKLVKGDGNVRITRQSKGRKGKTVTLVTGLPLNHDELKALSKQLKTICGCGGSVKDGAIEIQGDRRERLKEELQKRGYESKYSG